MDILCQNGGDCTDCCDGEKSCPDAFCDQGWCDPWPISCVCDLGCGAQCEVDSDCDPDGCSGACPGCEYEDYYCDTGSCNCPANNYNPDWTSGPCAGGACCTACGETWLSSGVGAGARCCGDDAGEDWDTAGDASQGCCCNENQIGTGNDELCSGHYWCLDGVYCTGGGGVVRDMSLAAEDTTYALSGDDIICGCDAPGEGDKCDTDRDGTAEGICTSVGVTPQCDTDLVSKSGSTYYSSCSVGYECDSDVTPSEHAPQYVQDGYCTGADDLCCTGSQVAVDTGNDGWGDGNDYCRSCTDTADGNNPCDTNPADGFNTVGYCTEGNDACCSGNAVSKTDSTWGNTDDYCESCDGDAGDPCDSNAANGLSTTGYCTDGDDTCCGTGSSAYSPDATWGNADDQCGSCGEAAAGNARCDATYAGPGSTTEGYCTEGDSTCCSGNAVDESSDGWGNADDTCQSCDGDGNKPCDSNALDGLSTTGYCTDGDDTCCSGNAIDNSQNGWGNADDLCTSCSATHSGDPCDSNALNGLTTTGYCCDQGGWSCQATGTMGYNENCCGVDALCGSGMECLGGVCKYSDGEPCTDGDDCVSGICTDSDTDQIPDTCGPCDGSQSDTCGKICHNGTDYGVCTGGGSCYICGDQNSGNADPNDWATSYCENDGNSCSASSTASGGAMRYDGENTWWTRCGGNSVCSGGAGYAPGGTCQDADADITGITFYDADGGQANSISIADILSVETTIQNTGTAAWRFAVNPAFLEINQDGGTIIETIGSSQWSWCYPNAISNGQSASCNLTKDFSCDSTWIGRTIDPGYERCYMNYACADNNWNTDISYYDDDESPVWNVVECEDDTDAVMIANYDDGTGCDTSGDCDNSYCSGNSVVECPTDLDSTACTNADESGCCSYYGYEWISATGACCGDDSGEENRTRECDGHACITDSSDEACCDQASDCVWQGACYNNGAGRPGLAEATCVNGVWEDTTAPTTFINPNDVTYTNQNETTFTLSCTDTGGAFCDETKYRIIDEGQESQCTDWSDLTGTYTGSPVDVTCPFGQTCRRKVCFASNDSAGNTESMNISGVFHLETQVCMNRECGSPCWYTPGVCDGDYGSCYPQGGCLLDCTAPDPGPGNQRSWVNSDCGRTGSYKCGDSEVCSNSYTSCTTGGNPTEVTGSWTTYTYPSGYYGVGDTIQISLSGFDIQPPGFTVVSECKLNKSDNSIIYFNNWGTDVTFSYTIQSGDPEGTWIIDYCGLWSDFLGNGGWELLWDQTDISFSVDNTAPSTSIDLSGTLGWSNWYRTNVQVTLTCSESGGSGCSSTEYCVDTTDTCSPSTSYSSPFIVSDEGTNYVRYYSTDSVGNQETTQSQEIKIDKTNPAFVSYSVSGCDYEDAANQICWVRQGTTTTHQIQHTDAVSTPLIQYLTFTSDCTPNNCGCIWDDLCTTGDEIKSNVNVDTGALSDSMWNDDYLDIQSVSCVGDCSGTDANEQWIVVTGTNQNNYTVYTFLYDEAGRGVGYTDTGWRYISDTSPPVSSVFNLPQYTQSTIFNIFWGGSDDGSGVDCYRIEYQYNDTQNLNPWEILFDCTTQTTTTFNAYEKAGSPPGGINFYTFYFRSLARDNLGTWEVKTDSDTNTTIFASELVNFFVVDEFGNIIPDKGKTSTDRTVSITVSNKSMDLLDITINYSVHSPRSEAIVWENVTCEGVRTCVATLGPYTSDQRVDYYTYVFNTNTGEVERNPPMGSYSFTMYEHPLANFALESLSATVGKTDLIEMRARNIQLKADTVHLRLEPDNVLFSENGQSEIDIDLNPQEEKTVYARVLFSGYLRYNITLTASSSVDPNLMDSDTVKVTMVFAPEFPGLSPPAIALLLILAVLVYLKLVRTEN